MKPWQTSPLLKVEHLTMRFGGLTAVDDVSFAVGRNDITALIGPNGAGKTTVFNCITGFYKPTEGLMQLTHPDGRSFNLERLDDHDINSRARVARTFQNIRLFQGMTVLENLMVAQHNVLMRASGFTIGAILGIGGFGKAEKDAIELARALARPGGADATRRRAGRLAALWRPAAARDRARDVHAAAAALPRRAGRGLERARERRAERAAVLHPQAGRHRAAADRA